MNHTHARVTKTSFNKIEKMIERLLEGVLEKLVGKIEMFFLLVKKCLIYWRLHCLFFLTFTKSNMRKKYSNCLL